MSSWCRQLGLAAARVALCCLFSLLASPSSQGSELPIDARSLRGVWLERFTRFVEWPTGHRVSQIQLPFELCVIDDPAFADVLATLYSSQRIKGKTVRVHKLDASTNPLPNCDLLFLAEVPTVTRDAILQKARSSATLVVSASDGYAAAGSHINLYEEKGYLRFEINLDAVQQAGLSVSSHLLNIARVIRQKEGS